MRRFSWLLHAAVTGACLLFVETVMATTPTTTTYTGDTTGDFHDPVTLSATLVLAGTSIPVAGQVITFTIGTQSCPGTTNASGFASCTLTLNQSPGPYTVIASFAGGSGNFPSSASAPFTITREETTTTYAGPTVIANNVNTTFSAVLTEDGAVPISGRTITITLGTGATAQTCNGTTDASGTATCTILVNQPLGAGTVAADFAGDAFYLPSSGSATTILPTLTPTPTPTLTPTATPTVTPTNTPVPIGGACTGSAQCGSTFCVDSVCCDTACTGPLEKCNLPGEAGKCASAAAPAPALTPWGLMVAAILLVSVAGFALRHRMRGR
jgi:hypothetical protein